MMLAVPGVLSLTERPFARNSPKPYVISLFFTWLFLTIIIGFRYQVGADWGGYLKMLFNARGMSLSDLFLSKDPGYNLLNWLSVYSIDSIWPVNIFCGAVFALGLIPGSSARSISLRFWSACLWRYPSFCLPQSTFC